MIPTSNSCEIHVVLVRPLYSRNVGGVSRALGNMGGHRLILVNPQCEVDYEARQGAAGAQKHLIEHTHYESWDQFYKKEAHGVYIAFCARKKIETDTLEYAARVKNLVSEKIAFEKPIYLIFGPEDHGLSNDDTRLANFICALPTYGSFESLNLSHAVLLALYILQNELKLVHLADAPVLAREEFYFPDNVLQTWLHDLGFEFGERRTDVYKVLKRILLRNLASPKELRILEAVLFQTVRKIKK
jgi:TrmH family RNA methyltransferase